MRYYAELPEIDPEAGLPESAVEAQAEAEARYNLVLAHYLVGSISLGRAAELLEIPWLELRPGLCASMCRCAQHQVTSKAPRSTLPPWNSRIRILVLAVRSELLTLVEANALLNHMVAEGYHSPVERIDSLV